jgi:hypothetical protein
LGENITFKNGRKMLGTGQMNISDLGVASITTSALPVGTYSITAVYKGDPGFTSSTSLPDTQTVTQASQTITFNAISAKKVGGKVSLTALATSGLAVDIASQTKAVCTVSGTTAKLVAAGTCSIQATQAGNSNYLPAPPVTQSFTVNP